jgi:hypothetical protein
MASDDDNQPATTTATTTEFQNKLEAQAKAKGGLSYTYFAASGSGGAAPPPAPAAPVSAEQAAAVEANAAKPTNGSAWNAAGTYEERDVSAWARTRVEALLLEAGGSAPCGKVAVTSAACTGEAHVVFVRGKRRAAFELRVSMGWRSGENDQIQGTAKTREEVTGDDIDDESDVELTASLDAAIGGGVKDGGDAAAAEAAVKAAREGLRGVLCERLRQLRQEMRDGKAA